MRIFVLFLFVIFAVFVSKTSAQYTDHARVRSAERDVDLDRAITAIRLGETAWKVNQIFENGKLRHHYEGYYGKGRKKVYFHLVRATDGSVITVWRLYRPPKEPML